MSTIRFRVSLLRGVITTERHAAEDALTRLDTKERFVLATSSLPGEGFDDAFLDTLFLTRTRWA